MYCLFLGLVALQWLHGFGKRKVVCGACDFGYATKFILLELSSPSKRIFIDSHSLPSSLVTSLVLHTPRGGPPGVGQPLDQPNRPWVS
jgi:hypothetical protein